MFKYLAPSALVIMVLSLSPALGQAPPSGPCPPGAVPIPGQGRCGSPAEASAANRGSGISQPVYSEVWENRFGAIAVDYAQGKSGIAESKKSARIARNEALKLCGTKSCKIVARIRNGCLVATYGGGFAYGGGSTVEQAIADGMAICQADGSKCEIQYSGCSLPVRVK